MKVDFSGDEIEIFDFDELEAYKIARKLEEDGLYYYSRMKEEVLKPEIRAVIELLLAEERKHLHNFEDKIEELVHEQKVLDEEETLPEIVDSHVMDVLKDSKRVADILCNPQEALRLGIAVEKRTIAFYQTLQKNTSDNAGKEALSTLIEEEKQHISKLEGLLR
jgi:rubrerythrin